MAEEAEKKVEKIEENAVERKSGKPSWVKMKKEDLDKIVVGLAKEGKSPAEIGAVLRDKHGIPKARLLGRKVGQILRENKAEIKDEEKIIADRVEGLKEHIGRNKHDYPASRALTKKLWVLRKISNEKAN